MFPLPDARHITGLILAGGRARRLDGQDKGLITLGKRPLIDYVIERLRPQVGDLLINANRHQDRYRQFHCPVIADSLPDFAGPLAGLLAGLENTQHEWLVSVPCDNPWLPLDLVERLISGLQAQPRPLAVVRSGEQLQPVYCLAHRSLRESLSGYLAADQHKVREWVLQQDPCIVEFDQPAEFENINTPQQLSEAEQRL